MVVIVLCICSTQWHHVSFWFMFNKHIYECTALHYMMIKLCLNP